jgi:hypothetical protein
MTRVNQTQITIVAALVVLSAVTVGALGTTGASASEATLGHGLENGNYTVSLPFNTDHYPASKNPGGPHNASINHFAAGTDELFEEVGAEDGLEKLEYIVIGNPDIDFSQCSTSNTAAFGIDRDNDEPGTLTNVDLLSYLEKNKFNDSHIVVKLYDGDELGASSREDKGGKETGREDGDKNPELYKDDEIVAHQGYRSSAGPCYRMPDTPGWYQIDGKANGTTFQGSPAEVKLTSHYFYICECDSEKAAYEQLGPPPGQDNPYAQSTPTSTPTPEPTASGTPTEASGGGGDSGTPTPTSAPEATPTPTPTSTPEATPTPTATATPTPTPTATATASPTATPTATPAGRPDSTDAPGTVTATAAPQTQPPATQPPGGGGQPPANQQQPEGVRTPTAGAGPGFGLVAALGGLLALGLLARRR